MDVAVTMVEARRRKQLQQQQATANGTAHQPATSNGVPVNAAA
jgi:acetyl-CoA carboxylase carboxyl transferase subunit alpha